MNLEVGQYINNGVCDLLVCAKDEYKNKIYVYVLNEEADEAMFYEMTKKDDLWEFNKVNSVSLIKQLIIHFSNIKENLNEVTNE